MADGTDFQEFRHYHRGCDDDFPGHLFHDFIRRIFREIMQLKAADSNLLTFLLFSFAYVLLVTFVDDHFGMSLFSCR